MSYERRDVNQLRRPIAILALQRRHGALGHFVRCGAVRRVVLVFCVGVILSTLHRGEGKHRPGAAGDARAGEHQYCW